MSRKLEGSWITHYLRYTSEHESPESFHLWTGLSLIACVLRRNIVLDMGQYKVYPNIFVVQVATTGECRKTAGATIGYKLLNRLNEKQELTHKFNIMKQKTTPEGLIMRMQGVELCDAGMIVPDGSIFIFAPELRVFLSEGVARDLIPLLTDFYDCPDSWDYTTRVRSIETVNNVCITILACSTPKWLGQCIAEDAQAGGFTSRVFFIVESKGRKNLKPYRDLELETLLVNDLYHIRSVKGNVQFTKEAYAFFNDWYNKTDLKSDDDEMAGWHSRMHVHIMKIAMLMAISESDALVLEKRHVEGAMEAIAQLEKRMPLAFAHVGATREAEIGERIVRHLQRAEGWLGHSSLMRSVYKYVKDGNEFKTLMESLTIRDVIRTEVTVKGIFYALKEHAKRELPHARKGGEI